MYEKIKQIIKRLIPNSFLTKNEALLRTVYYQFYRGTKYHCNICNKSLRKFIQLKNEDKLCPSCGSISRNRRLWNILENDFLKGDVKILDFSPSRSIYRKLKMVTSYEYISSDYAGEFIANQHYDIARIDLPDNSFDLIICYHILEHIEDDQKAMKELFRILKKGGHCIIQTPFTEGEIVEDPSIRSAEDRLKHFGQADHVRIYSVAGLIERLTKNGFFAELTEFNEDEDNKCGFRQKEFVIIANKTTAIPDNS